MSYSDLPAEVLCNIALTIDVITLKSLRCVCSYFHQVFSDSYICDLKDIKLYDHQRRAVKFILERDEQKLNSLINLDTGTGKTAVVLYAYQQRQVPTAIVLKKKHIPIWKRELAKYNVKIPIMTVNQVTECDVSGYERFIIDEVHEKLFKSKEQSNNFISATKHGVIWGLSASTNFISVGGTYKHIQIIRLFENPSSMITIRLNQLDPAVRNKFKLPNFHVINSIEYIRDIKDKEAYIDISVYLSHVVGILRYNIILTCNYTSDIHLWIQNNTSLRCPYIDMYGVVTLDGMQYYNFSIDEWVDNYNKFRYFNFNGEIVNLVRGKRSIVYSYDRLIMCDMGYDAKYTKYPIVKLCELFMDRVIDTLILSPSYNAGYNFGHIDVVVINCHASDYPTFKQIMGRINRLDQQNTTDVYILHRPGDSINPQLLINQYKNEFV